MDDTKIAMDKPPPSYGQDGDGGHVNPALQLDDEGEEVTTAQQNETTVLPERSDYEEIISGEDFDDLEFEPNVISRLESKVCEVKRSVTKSLGDYGDFILEHGVKIVCLVLYLVYFFR